MSTDVVAGPPGRAYYGYADFKTPGRFPPAELAARTSCGLLFQKGNPLVTVREPGDRRR